MEKYEDYGAFDENDDDMPTELPKVKMTTKVASPVPPGVNDVPAMKGNVETVAGRPLIRVNAAQKKIADAIIAQIDIMNAGTIQGLDTEINKKLSAYNTDVLSQAKMFEMGGTMGLIMDVKKQAKSVSPAALAKLGKSTSLVGRLFGRAKNGIDKVKARYETVEHHFDGIAKRLEADALRMERDLSNMQTLYDINREQYSYLTAYIYAAQRKMEEITTVLIPKLRTAAEAGDDVMAHRLMIVQKNVDMLDKKISDMTELRMDTLHTAQTINILENSGRQLIESNRTTAYNAIEQWKKGVTIALSLRHQAAAADMLTQVKDMTNQMRIQNAQLLEQVATKTAQVYERGAIDYQTLETVNEKLIKTMDDIHQIHQDAKNRRIEEGRKIAELENRLKTRVIAG